MVKYYVKKSNGKLSQRNTNKPSVSGITRKKRRNYINVQFSKPRINVASNKKIEKEKTPKLNSTKGKRMVEESDPLYVAIHTQQADIKSAITGYKKIIVTLQDKIKSNDKAIEKFNKTIEQNFKQLESLKDGNEAIISSFKKEMENIKQLHNSILLKENDTCNKLISETQENIKLLERELDKVSKMSLTKFGTTF